MTEGPVSRVHQASKGRARPGAGAALINLVCGVDAPTCFSPALHSCAMVETVLPSIVGKVDGNMCLKSCVCWCEQQCTVWCVTRCPVGAGVTQLLKHHNPCTVGSYQTGRLFQKFQKL